MERTMNTGEVSLFVRETDGKTVLFVHGFPLNHTMWKFQLDALGGEYRMIAPDLRGLGKSDVPEPYTSYSMDAYAYDLKNLLDRMGVSKVVLVGLSMGGYISFAFNRLFPERIRALVLVDTRAGADSPEGFEGRMNAIESVKGGGPGAIVDGMIPKLFSPETLEKNPDVVDDVRSMMEQQNPVGVMGALWAMAHRPDSRPDLPGIHVPALVVVGEDDVLTPPSEARSMADAIPGARLEVIPMAGHMSPMEAPERFNEVLLEFLRGLP
jgi:3-oxoadipate enol-lactonase